MRVVKSTIKNPLITVCLPTYNQENYIKETIESVLSQRSLGLQIIVSDDASKDATPNILKSYKKMYPANIDLILHSSNLGVSSNVVSILPFIRGKYVCWFSGDDMFLLDKLKKQVEFMEENPSFVMCYHDVLVRDHNKNIDYRYIDSLDIKLLTGDITSQLITERCFIPGISVMVRQSYAADLKNDPRVGVCEDWLFFIELSMRGPVKYINEVLAVYRRHGKNITRTNVNYLNEEKVYDFIENKYYKKYENQINMGKINAYSSYFFKYIFNGRIKESIFLIKKLSSIFLKSPLLIIFFFKRLALNLKKYIVFMIVSRRFTR
jgi:glycosyltransferase involved in cell wall biosynthesis